ncbi:MAG: indole-3-glycerol phosphate synthase TrpC [Prevotella sp.]|nr:indole-3-glycerol phosphate synthase TrpC [Prevotella sp.]
MKDVLDEIVAWKRVEVEQFKRELPPRMLYKQVEAVLESPVASMKEALKASDTGIIAEFKRRSPSKGWIREDGKAEEIPLAYQSNGASAISILTDAKYFGGCDGFVMDARRTGVTIPVLYKNFVVDEYQLFQARLCGASAVLLIAADLTLAECRTLLHTAHELRLEVLLEMHGEGELDYAALEPDMCGINNRNLGTFVTDVDNSYRMADRLPRDIVKVSESGISSVLTVKELRRAGYQGFLIGEYLMKMEHPGHALRAFIQDIKSQMT